MSFEVLDLVVGKRFTRGIAYLDLRLQSPSKIQHEASEPDGSKERRPSWRRLTLTDSHSGEYKKQFVVGKKTSCKLWEYSFVLCTAISTPKVEHHVCLESDRSAKPGGESFGLRCSIDT